MVLSSPIINDEVNQDSVNESSNEEEIIGEVSVVEVIDSEISNAEVPTDIETTESISPIEDVCNTPECQNKAKEILNSLNLNVDPCDDFYEFACGNFKGNNKSTEISEGDVFDNIANENYRMIRETLEKGYQANENLTPEEQKYEKTNFEKVANFFNSCMDMETIDTVGVQPIIDLLDELKINENRTKYNNVEDLTDLLVRLSIHDVNFLFDKLKSQNFKNPKVISFYTGQPSVGLKKKELYENPEEVSNYKNVMKVLLSKVFENQKERNIEKMVETVFEFEKKLSNILDDYGQNLQEDYVKAYTLILMTIQIHVDMNMRTLNETLPFINWKNYFNKEYENLGMETRFDDDSEIVIVNPEYFKKLNGLIKETDSETIASYAEWSVVRKYSNYLAGDIMKELNDYYDDIYQSSKRETFCMDLFLENLDRAVGRIYIEKAFKEEDKRNVETMISNIEETMTKRIKEMPWLDEETRKNALNKMEHFTHAIGYPDYIAHPKDVYEFYKDLEITPNEFVRNVINSRVLEVTKNLEQGDDGKYYWIIPTFIVNAYSDPRVVKYVFPAGILQKPFYDPSNPDYMNYGSIGMVIGHELSHAFDNNGSNFDYEGKVNNWWTNSTRSEFNELSQCFVDQYSQYYIVDINGKEQHVNGYVSLGENIADNGGLSRGYEAWKLSLENNPKAKEINKKLPGLSQFTNDQLYFISFGQSWCRKSDIKKDIDHLMNEHPPAKFRVIGTVANNEYFAKAFNCPIKSPMNPEDKLLNSGFEGIPKFVYDIPNLKKLTLNFREVQLD
ncbi:zincin [Anaeromyces robustus]|uniref:Zincin n=1 Tax=Anaeromyces robustus TaxID=1754192 RepID=A0A1Y1X0K4_9FUNG|nr:zincin [Anaeromyces robustus]|eukprot:ORX79341.1 zincin [Anaeromyces robustus]